LVGQEEIEQSQSNPSDPDSTMHEHYVEYLVNKKCMRKHPIALGRSWNGKESPGNCAYPHQPLLRAPPPTTHRENRYKNPNVVDQKESNRDAAYQGSPVHMTLH
jgi:hypothetical protein